MSKELIEQLAKDSGAESSTWRNGTTYHYFTSEQLEAFAKAYQAAAPIDNVAEALERALSALSNAEFLLRKYCPNHNWLNGFMRDKESVRALIPDTQASAQSNAEWVE